MGRTAYGVRGITLRDEDYVVAMETVSAGGTLLTVTEQGYGKRTEIEEYACSRAAASESSTSRRASGTGRSSASLMSQEGDELLVITQQGMILRMQSQ